MEFLAVPRSAGRQRNWGHPDHDACGTGFIAGLHGPARHEIIQLSLQALERLSHRGGVDADGASGDGAGLLTSLPINFFRARAAEERLHLGELFGVGMLFVPPTRVTDARAAIEESIGRGKLRLAGWRRVPVNANSLGQRAFETMPEIWQFFIGPTSQKTDEVSAAKFERSLHLLRKRAESMLPERCYICSLSSRTIVYKGLLTPWQFPRYYGDLRSPEFTAKFAIFHQRYSTNTQPSWQLAQPFRYIAHNGEINTVISNRRWLRALEREIRKRIGVGKWFHLLEENVSDSASFDNALEIKLLEGKSVEAAMLALVPPAFQHDPFLSADVQAALEILSRDGAPWDGPAAMVFSDGVSVGVKLDRNGLRPMRYTVTHDGLVIAGSETGLVDLDESRVAERYRLGPGEMIVANPTKGVLLRWRELLKSVAQQYPRKTATQPKRVTLESSTPRIKVENPRRVAGAAGWSDDQYKILFRPLLKGKEADWSMGDDAPPAFLSTLQRPLWDYFKQRFAQVTNPPIDPLREAHVMSLDVPLGHGHFLTSPILSAGELAMLTASHPPVQTVDFSFPSINGVSGARRCLTQCITTPLSSDEHPRLLLLTDRAIGPERAAIPALLAVASTWKSMVKEGLAGVPLVVETAQVFDTHHLAMLIAAGASAVVPYLAEEFAESEEEGAFEKVCKAMFAGLRKVLARMGISTLASYRNSHLFEALGLDEDICREYFEDAGCYPGTKSSTCCCRIT
jgi:glutamate synthase domain-containing protein 1